MVSGRSASFLRVPWPRMAIFFMNVSPRSIGFDQFASGFQIDGYEMAIDIEHEGRGVAVVERQCGQLRGADLDESPAAQRRRVQPHGTVAADRQQQSVACEGDAARLDREARPHRSEPVAPAPAEPYGAIAGR